MLSIHCPHCGDSYPPGIFVCPNDQTPYPREVSGEVVVPTRVDIKLPETYDESASLLSNPNETNKESKAKPSSLQFVVEPGTVIGEYVVEQKLGQGGMGEIWRAVQPLIGKQVAIKILRGKIASDEDSVERFIREAKAVNAIKHRALVDIFSFGDLPDGRPYFVMEYLQGQSLLAHIAENGPLSWSEIVTLFTQLCEALQATHEQGIIHRDLKCENLFLVKEPGKPFVVKVLDFGLAKLVDPDQENAQLTQDGVVFGTPAYMAPEQCKGETSALSDIYSLGVILFETITGRTPFSEPGVKAAEVMLRQLGEPAPAPSSVVSGRVVPKSVDALVLALLSKSPKERPQSCSLLVEKIQAVLGPLAKSAVPHEPRSAKPIFLSGPHRVRQRSSTGVIALIIASFILVGIIAGLFLGDDAPAPEAPVASAPVVEPPTTIAATAPVTPKPVTLAINSLPQGADVLFDGKVVGQTPFLGEVPYSEAKIVVSIQQEGFQTFESEITPTATYNWLLSLERVGSKKKSRLTNDSAEKSSAKKPPASKDDLIDDPFVKKKKP